MWIDNRIVRLDGIENTFDGAGNLIRRKDKDGAILELSYDGAHRLSVLRRSNPDGTKLRAWYAYDALSRRIAKGVSKDGGKETLTYHEKQKVWLELITNTFMSAKGDDPHPSCCARCERLQAVWRNRGNRQHVTR
ncbi:MAG: RHS repeat protein [Azoarcus sp.]|nr:RHS repeat protein [Azoarcus sp.]